MWAGNQLDRARGGMFQKASWALLEALNFQCVGYFGQSVLLSLGLSSILMLPTGSVQRRTDRTAILRNPCITCSEQHWPWI